MQMADAMATNGYKEAGYEYITVDDCWPADHRDKDGRLQPDPTRFPHGMKALADYVRTLSACVLSKPAARNQTCVFAEGG